MRRERRGTTLPLHGVTRGIVTVLITVAGAPGTGTTTLCRLLAARLGLPHVDAGQFFRALAREYGMTLAELGRFAETHPDVDRELDRRMIERARAGDVILEGRLSGWHAQQADVPALRVLLVAPDEVRAERVARREGRATVAAVLQENRAREASEAARYLAFYGFDPRDPAGYDLVVDSSLHPPDHIADLVEQALSAGAGRSAG